MLQTKHYLDIPLRVAAREEESSDCRTIIFDRPRNFHFASGQWLDLRFRDAPPESAKTFSFASAPTESDLRITYRRGVSRYKRALDLIQPGEAMVVTQYGGGFRLDPRRPALLVAGGVGVAPFRSMIREAMDTRVNTSIELIYLNSSSDFAYRGEFEVWCTQFPALRIHYVATRDEGRLERERVRTLVPDVTHRNAYVAGPPSMVLRVYQILKLIGVHEDRIQTDSFDGY